MTLGQFSFENGRPDRRQLNCQPQRVDLPLYDSSQPHRSFVKPKLSMSDGKQLFLGFKILVGGSRRARSPWIRSLPPQRMNRHAVLVPLLSQPSSAALAMVETVLGITE